MSELDGFYSCGTTDLEIDILRALQNSGPMGIREICRELERDVEPCIYNAIRALERNRHIVRDPLLEAISSDADDEELCNGYAIWAIKQKTQPNTEPLTSRLIGQAVLFAVWCGLFLACLALEGWRKPEAEGSHSSTRKTE